MTTVISYVRERFDDTENPVIDPTRRPRVSLVKLPWYSELYQNGITLLSVLKETTVLYLSPGPNDRKKVREVKDCRSVEDYISLY